MSVLEMKSGSTSSVNEIQIIIFLSFSSRKLHKNYQMSDKIDSHIYLMLSVKTKVFINQSNVAGKEIIYYKI